MCDVRRSSSFGGHELEVLFLLQVCVNSVKGLFLWEMHLAP